MKIVVREFDVMLHDDEVVAGDDDSHIPSRRLWQGIAVFAKASPGTYDVRAIECPGGAWTLQHSQSTLTESVPNTLIFDGRFAEALCNTAVRALGLEDGKTYALMMTRIGD